MATNTTNYNLVKPDEEDFYDIANNNNNMDIIDTNLKTISDIADSADEKGDTALARLPAYLASLSTDGMNTGFRLFNWNVFKSGF